MKDKKLTAGEEKFLRKAIKGLPKEERDKLMAQIAPQHIPGGYWTRNHFHLTGFGKEALGQADIKKFERMTKNIDIDTLSTVQKMKYNLP